MADLHRTYRVAACGVLALSVATAARAQVPPTDRPARPSTTQAPQRAAPGTPLFAQRIAGLDINVFTLDGGKYSGIFTISGTRLVSQDGWLEIEFDTIRRVEKNSYRMRLHSLIGLGIGSGIGLTALAGSGCRAHDSVVNGRPVRISSNCGFVFLLAVGAGGAGAAIGSAVGGILNVRHEPNDVIFERPGGTSRTIAWAPILTGLKKGIAFTIAWR